MLRLSNQSLKDFTNYKIGGNTPKLYIPRIIEELREIPDKDLYNAYILGNGTNLLISDNGVNRPVIKIDFQQFFLNKLSGILLAGAGCDLTIAAKNLAEEGYRGLIHVAGIPGSIGGAVAMNASASHGSVSDYIITVEAFNKETKERKVFTKSECRFGFRSSIFQNSPWIITFVEFGLEKEDKQELIKLYESIINYRKKNYPLTLPSAGCWFRRDWGGKDIVKKIGMSGAIKGGAIVSPMFPAFILNANNATAKDVYSLVKEIQYKAKTINEEMPLEIIIWGDI